MTPMKMSTAWRGLNLSIKDPDCLADEYLAEQLRQIDIPPQAIVLEPVGRNTAPAIALAALEARRNLIPELEDALWESG